MRLLTRARTSSSRSLWVEAAREWSEFAVLLGGGGGGEGGGGIDEVADELLGVASLRHCVLPDNCGGDAEASGCGVEVVREGDLRGR